MTHALLRYQPPSFNTILKNGISYITVHARGIPYTYETMTNFFNKHGGAMVKMVSDVETILIPTLDGNLEEVLDKALRDIKEKGILK